MESKHARAEMHTYMFCVVLCACVSIGLERFDPVALEKKRKKASAETETEEDED